MAVAEQINASGAGVVWVSLGCPKQESWMVAHRGRINAVMVGVGAAFDYHAGTIQRAPQWMQGRGLEWLHRLASEPRRLWRRYLVTNTLFVLGAARQLLLARGQTRR
ncbi:WecB/TagA/CpsF family glycosyltransferase [Acidovorax sp.]|uniref:WecB/TagA/CpsF family glycosyltransferase n=1 Tax=Acidovorax sp. TaxID=1872122 RepID=UPI003BB0FCD4